jgi:hypothetical protein
MLIKACPRSAQSAKEPIPVNDFCEWAVMMSRIYIRFRVFEGYAARRALEQDQRSHFPQDSNLMDNERVRLKQRKNDGEFRLFFLIQLTRAKVKCHDVF